MGSIASGQDTSTILINAKTQISDMLKESLAYLADALIVVVCEQFCLEQALVSMKLVGLQILHYSLHDLVKILLF